MASGFRLAFFLCVTFGVLISATWSSPSKKTPLRGCYWGWKPFGSRCFIVMTSSRTMADAERICTYYGGNLASVHSYSEHNFIRRLIYLRFRRSVPTWIGLFDAIQERRWMWTDGSRVRFTYWSRGEPNNKRNEDCTEMNWKGFYWNDIRCHSRRPYVCARRM